MLETGRLYEVTIEVLDKSGNKVYLSDVSACRGSQRGFSEGYVSLSGTPKLQGPHIGKLSSMIADGAAGFMGDSTVTSLVPLWTL